MKRAHHRLFLNSQNSAIRHRGCCAHAERLACKRTLAEETPISQYADRCLLASCGNNGEFYAARLQIKNCVRGISLLEDGFLLRNEFRFPTLADSGEEILGVKIAVFLLIRQV